ncbi:hypothetical protein SpCBS45565_g06756 [Spizellomyces sp. 'palustris']|nr:hypothetical protein SpCBS45565_g06756 [Spizellomyces sp. 'palustris']
MWLRNLLAQNRLPYSYEPYVKNILQGPLDAVERCEALLGITEEILGPKPAEKFVRDVLDALEMRGADSLIEDDIPVEPPAPTSLPKKAATKSVFKVDAPEFTPLAGGWSELEVSFQRLDTSDTDDTGEDGDAAYLDYEESEGYNPFSPEEILQSVFMDLPVDEIQNMLAANGYSVEKTVEAILRPPAPVPSSSPLPTQSQGTGNSILQPFTQPGKQVCRHFLAGRCLRSDCWFSHDPEAMVCKFWLSGTCMKGDQCLFTHGNELVQRIESMTAPTSTGSPRQSLGGEDFPALTPSTPKKAPKIDFWGPTQKFVDVAKKKPVVQPAIVAAKQSAQSPVTSHRRSTKLVEAKWVSTGDTLAAMYARYRQEAIDAAIQRNKLFQRATEAYISGNKAAAKAFSLGAHRLNERVQELHRQAGVRIFEERNKAGTNSDPAGHMIDLHGLHPTEAVEMLEVTIGKLRREHFGGHVVAVTGTGHHSRGQKAKVLPAIRDYLHRVGLKAQEGTMRDGRGGMFTIQL